MLEQKKWDLRMAAAARTGRSVESVDLVLLPAYSQKTVARGKRRKELLRDYLREQLAAVSDLPPADRTRSSEAGGCAPPSLDLESVCGKCRGHCCRKGGEHAYVSARTLRRVLAADPTIDGDVLIDTYLSHVPARSYAGSCIYHSASGCGLPRALRSETCTDYFCGGLKTLSESVSQHPERAVVGVFELEERFPPMIARVMMVHDGRIEEMRPKNSNTRK